MDALKHYRAGESGTPQGAVISPLLANLYLDPLDQLMGSQGKEMVRYADDFVVLCRTREDAIEVLRAIQRWVEQAGLKLHPEKTRIVDATQPGGFDFLGYHFEQGYKTPRPKSLKKFKERIRQVTRRTSGQSMEEIIAALTPLMRGWFNYFCHSRKWVFPTLDQWIRGRLRSILRRRHGLRGRSHGRDHQRWPNSAFTALGYFSLEAAWKAAKSLQR